MSKRKRRFWSIKKELLTKGRESMLCAVQIFNNPNVTFKSETFIVLCHIAWTYLLHSYYRKKGIEYRYYEQKEKQKRYDKTKNSAFKYWELERCLNDKNCPIDKTTASNLRFMIGLRHEIEHQMTSRIDDYLSARFQACCLNFNHYIKKLFGIEYGIDHHLSFSLQFSTIKEDHANQLKKFSELPEHIAAYINDFDNELSQEEYEDIRYSYRVLYVPKSANRKGQADRVIEFLPADSEEAKTLNKEYVLIKDREKPKYLPSEIVEKMQKRRYVRFRMHEHTQLWKEKDAKNPKYHYGVQIAKSWYWYENWFNEVEQHCKDKKALFTLPNTIKKQR